MVSRKSIRISVVAWLVLLACASSALAHSMYVFAEVDGTTIRGKAYFRGNIPARGMTVTAFDPAGERLGQTKTDQQGRFTLMARFRCDHRLVVDTGDGHGAEFKVVAAQLPEDLPPRGGTSGSIQRNDVGPDSRTTQSPDPAEADAPGVAPTASGHVPLEPLLVEIRELRKEIGRLDQSSAIRADIGQLREDLAAEKQRMRLNGIVGGIGCILGISGAAFYFLGVRRKQSRMRQ